MWEGSLGQQNSRGDTNWERIKWHGLVDRTTWKLNTRECAIHAPTVRPQRARGFITRLAKACIRAASLECQSEVQTSQEILHIIPRTLKVIVLLGFGRVLRSVLPSVIGSESWILSMAQKSCPTGFPRAPPNEQLRCTCN